MEGANAHLRVKSSKVASDSHLPLYCFRMIRSGEALIAEIGSLEAKGQAAHPAWVSSERRRSHRTWHDAKQIGFHFQR